ncbi:cobalamin synthase [Escherichia coli]|uniref:Adenosylcobinamide-GDP ribazoletransferase n=1 Tax=Escherichia coli TaxID=562 RepID=A0A2X1NDR6_ECOLX|nr:cobalamin synthase [Escherichia coli]
MGDALIYYASACTASLVPGLDFEHYSRGIITFPLIGLLLGAISGLVFMVLQAWCAYHWAALFSVLVLALMTGGFHLDGLAIPVMAYFCT